MARSLAAPLESFYASLLESVPTGPVQGPGFVFTTDSIDRPPEVSSTSNAFCRVGTHVYSDSCRIDLIDLVLGRTTARAIGCLVIGTLLHGSRTELSLAHPDSAVKRFVVDHSHPSAQDLPAGLAMTPFAVRYFPGEEKREPWASRKTRSEDLPWLTFTNRNEMCVNEEQLSKRDTVLVGGGASGLAALGELLLNAGRPDAHESEFSLEVDVGVPFSSAELNLWLPGSLLWQHLPEVGQLSADQLTQLCSRSLSSR